MDFSSDISPVGWYIATYLLRFVELAEEGNDDPERRFLTWENTILVKAADLDEAYEKAMLVGKEHTVPYKGGLDAVDVQWLFEGVIELLPIYEELEDGAEILWAERTKKLKSIRKLVKQKGDFHQSMRAATPQTVPADRAKPRSG